MVLEELAAVQHGGLRTVLVGGEPGVGKTTFLCAVARAVCEPEPSPHISEHPCQVLYGRWDEEVSVALQPFRTMVALLVENAADDLLVDHVHRCGIELGRVTPALARRLADNQEMYEPVPSRTSSDHETDRHLLFDAVADLLRRVAERSRLVLFLDDLQWAEPSSLLLLRHLAAELRQAPILVIVSYRDAGATPTENLRKTLSALDRGVSRRVTLRGLTDDELRELVVTASSMGRDPDAGPIAGSGDLDRVAARLRKDTAGNALFASQLIRHWIDTGGLWRHDPNLAVISASLRDVVSTRVSALGENAVSILSAAAVLGAEFREQHVTEMVDAGQSEIDESIDAAVSAGLLQATDTTAMAFRFTHALVASTLYDELAGLLADAQRWCTVAADHAFEHLAPSEAAHWYDRALQHAQSLARPAPEGADLLVSLGHARQRAGEPDAFELLARGAQLARAWVGGAASSTRSTQPPARTSFGPSSSRTRPTRSERVSANLMRS